MLMAGAEGVFGNMTRAIIAQSRARLKWATDPSVDPGGSYNVYCDGGDASIDYETPINSSAIPAWPDGRGYYGFGVGRFGMGAFGIGEGGAGFGLGGFGLGEFGFGAAMLEYTTGEMDDGDYLLAVVAVDAAGNKTTPAAIEEDITLAGIPDPPTDLAAESYDDATDTLTLSWTLSQDDTETT